ncbi:hypothetical protein C8R46DRAFT_907836, partial [Mycena filopes]
MLDHGCEVNAVLDDGLFTRASDPFKPARVAKILELVELGPDLSPEERVKARAFITAHADAFALSVGEVNAVKGASYAPRIPHDAVFNTGVVNQRPWSKPQNLNVNKQVDVLERAGILRPIAAKDVKCVSPIALAEK